MTVAKKHYLPKILLVEVILRCALRIPKHRSLAWIHRHPYFKKMMWRKRKSLERQFWKVLRTHGIKGNPGSDSKHKSNNTDNHIVETSHQDAGETERKSDGISNSRHGVDETILYPEVRHGQPDE